MNIAVVTGLEMAGSLVAEILENLFQAISDDAVLLFCAVANINICDFKNIIKEISVS